MNSSLPLANELAAISARMSGLLLSEQTVTTALDLVTSLAKETIAHAVGAGVTLINEQGKRTTFAATDPIVSQADDMQYELNEGPCLNAWSSRTLVRCDDIFQENRWPQWCASVRPLGLSAVVSAPLVAGDTALGAIKVYFDQPNIFEDRGEHLLTMFAGQAAVLLANVQTLENAQRLSTDLLEAMRTRDSVNVAKGVLMARENIDEETAFAMLISESREKHKPLSKIASSIAQSTVRFRR